MQPDIMAAIITALINFTRVWEGETAVAAGDREREREEKIYCDGFVHANLFSENWPLKRCGARGDNIVVALIASERKEDQSARDEGFDSQIHAPPPFTLTDLLQNAE